MGVVAAIVALHRVLGALSSHCMGVVTAVVVLCECCSCHCCTVWGVAGSVVTAQLSSAMAWLDPARPLLDELG